MPRLDMRDARRVIRAALAEDVGPGDITSAVTIPEGRRFRGAMRARHPMVVAGLPVAREVFRQVVPEAEFAAACEEGGAVAEGEVIAAIEGPARGLLTAERTALNLLQFMTGIATITRGYAEAIAGTGCTLLDTRKTLPGLRRLSKYAVACGGGRNHRIGLFDGVLIKDNHIAVCGGVRQALAAARGAGLTGIEIECDTLDQVAEAADAGADIILLDNMGPDLLRQAVRLIAGRAKTEASGGVRLETVRAVAESGVDFVSVGRLTQSAPAADIGLDWQ